MVGIAPRSTPRRLCPLAQELSAWVRTLEPADLAYVLTAGMTFTELPIAGSAVAGAADAPRRRLRHRTAAQSAVHPRLVLDRPRVAIPSLALPARMRETSLTDLIYAHHPRFLGVRRAYESRSAPVEGGDVLLLGAGRGGGRGGSAPRRPARKRWRSLFDDDLAHTVLAVPIAQERADASGHGVRRRRRCRGDVSGDQRLAVGVHHHPVPRHPDRRRGAVRDGRRRRDGYRPATRHHRPGPITAEREQWDDGNNTLALAPGVVVAYERNSETNARLADRASGAAHRGVRTRHRTRWPAVHVVPGGPGSALTELLIGGELGRRRRRQRLSHRPATEEPFGGADGDGADMDRAEARRARPSTAPTGRDATALRVHCLRQLRDRALKAEIAGCGRSRSPKWAHR
jgi:hypothetical protein